VRFGGHKAAAGLTLDFDRVDDFATAFAAAVERALGPAPYLPVLRPDLVLPKDALDLRLVEHLESLEPFGQHNPTPLFVARRFEVQRKRVVGDNHLKLTLSGIDAIAFRLGKLCNELPEWVDAIFAVERNTYAGRVSLQLRIEDLRAADG
jgi:single-stranded-DNA-specific exonuclease